MSTNQEELSFYEQNEVDLNKKIDNYNNEIADFFDFSKPVPNVFLNGETLREDFKRRAEKIAKRNNCVDCELNYFKAHYIEILVAHIKDA
jgi:hypothetical protein